MKIEVNQRKKCWNIDPYLVKHWKVKIGQKRSYYIKITVYE